MAVKLRNYHYLSASKTEMLFSQIPTDEAKKICLEMGVNFGVFTMKRTSTSEIKTKFQMISVVERYFENNFHSDHGLVAGKWEKFDFDCRFLLPEQAPGAVAFCGDWNGWNILLTGSVENLISPLGGKTYPGGYSFFPSALQMLQILSDQPKFLATGSSPEQSSRNWKFIFSGNAASHHTKKDSLLDMIRFRSVSSPVSTICRIFVVDEEERIALGSPVFVADQS